MSIPNQLRNSLDSVALLLLLVPLQLDAFRLRPFHTATDSTTSTDQELFPNLLYSRPECLPNESCLYKAFGYSFEMCYCPGEDDPECPENNNNVVYNYGISYNFCSADTHVDDCKLGELSITISGLRTIVHCHCRHSQHKMDLKMKKISKEESLFFCTRRPLSNATIEKMSTTTVA